MIPGACRVHFGLVMFVRILQGLVEVTASTQLALSPAYRALFSVDNLIVDIPTDYKMC